MENYLASCTSLYIVDKTSSTICSISSLHIVKEKKLTVLSLCFHNGKYVLQENDHILRLIPKFSYNFQY